MILNRIPVVVNGEAYFEKGRVDLEDLKVIKCCQDTGKCRVINEGLVVLDKKWECKSGQIYLSPKEIPEDDFRMIIMRLNKVGENKYDVSEPVLTIHADVVRECFMDVEEGG